MRQWGNSKKKTERKWRANEEAGGSQDWEV